MAEIRMVSSTEVSNSRETTLLLDVRTPAEFDDAHIEGAVLHPLGDLDVATVQGLVAGKKRCVVICRSGNRARQAAERLADKVMNLAVLDGGVGAWESAGLPLVRGKKSISLERQVRIAAGAMVLLGVGLGTLAHPGWYGLSAFIGAGLIVSGVTDTCGMAMMLAKMPWNTRAGRCGSSSCAAK